MNRKSPERAKEKDDKPKSKKDHLPENVHLGSSNAFEETESTSSRDPDDISDEKLDEMIGEE